MTTKTAQELKITPLNPEVAVYNHAPDMETVEIVHQIMDENQDNMPSEIVISPKGEFSFSSLPGAPEGVEIPEVKIEEEVEEKEDDQKAKSPKSQWDWELSNFFPWVQQRLSSIPKHSGTDIAGVKRAISYMERLLKEVHKAMEEDLDGELDSDRVEECCNKIEDGIDALEKHQSLLEDHKSAKKRKKKAELEIEELQMEVQAASELEEVTAAFLGIPSEQIVKMASKSEKIMGITISVPMKIYRLARTCINSTISGGHDVVTVFHKLIDKEHLKDDEVQDLAQLIQDMGFQLPLYDRGYHINETRDIGSGEFDLADQKNS